MMPDCLVLLVMKPFYNHLCKMYPVILRLAKWCEIPMLVCLQCLVIKLELARHAQEVTASSYLNLKPFYCSFQKANKARFL